MPQQSVHHGITTGLILHDFNVPIQALFTDSKM